MLSPQVLITACLFTDNIIVAMKMSYRFDIDAWRGRYIVGLPSQCCCLPMIACSILNVRYAYRRKRKKSGDGYHLPWNR